MSKLVINTYCSVPAVHAPRQPHEAAAHSTPRLGAGSGAAATGNGFYDPLRPPPPQSREPFTRAPPVRTDCKLPACLAPEDSSHAA